MELKTVWAIYFSATGTTQKVITRVAEAIAGALGAERKTYDITLPGARESAPDFAASDLVVLGTPVYAGRVPNVLVKYLASLRGNGALAVPVVLFGNRNYDDGLIELRDILESDGFHTIAAAAFVGEHSFSYILGAGRPDEADMAVVDRFAREDLADAVARFPGAAERVTDAGGRASALKVIESNADCFAEAPDGIFDAAAVGALREASWRVLAGVEGLLENRRAAGFVRHCHGDLHLRNICLFQGQATLFDAIEFSQEIANIDVLYDLAFLVMDLDHRGHRRLASMLLNRYLDITADIGGLAAMPLFLSLRAGIRSHVAALSSAAQSDAAVAEALRGEARAYLGEAYAYLEPTGPRLIAVGGLSGSGKSRLARDLAPLVGPSPGARVVRTDVTRKRLAGVGLETRLGSSGYSRDMTLRTYQAVYDECLAVLATGRAAIADAVFADPEERAAIEAVASDAGVPFHGLWLDSPPEVMQERVTHRRRNVSDATSWVVRLQLSYDLGDIAWPRIDTGSSREASLAQACAVLGIA